MGSLLRLQHAYLNCGYETSAQYCMPGSVQDWVSLLYISLNMSLEKHLYSPLLGLHVSLLAYCYLWDARILPLRMLV